MPNWGDVLKEIQGEGQLSPLDKVRRKYLRELSEYTNRNVIIYYSGWLQRNNSPIQSIVYDGDMNSFMCVINGLDRSKGLDLILHTPGGQIAATESIVRYLRKMFGNDIRCFIPQLAMSCGTMMACACKEIYMGKESSIGPIDPQFGPMPAFGVIEEFNRAAMEIKKFPEKIPLWQAIYSKIPASFITECQQAIERSESLVLEWLKTGMFLRSKNAEEKAKRVVSFLNNHHDTKAHDCHIDATRAQDIGLKIIELEKDNKLQDLVLTVHHACMHTFTQARDLQKIVENQNGIGTFLSGN